MSLRTLYLDIETAPATAMVWGLYGQNIAIKQVQEPGYTLCYAAKWDGGSKIHFDSLFHSSEKHMAKSAHALLDEADMVVHYNGCKFDIPHLNLLFLKNGLAPPAPYHQLDLLKVVRKHFRFTSNKLDFVCKTLGLGAKVQHKGMELWSECMEMDEKAWKMMRRYNEQDVVLLPRLYKKLLAWVDNHPSMILHGGEWKTSSPPCNRCGGETIWKGYRTTKTQKYRKFQCKKCGGWSRERLNCTTPEERRGVLVSA